jgi:hypothetical protein
MNLDREAAGERGIVDVGDGAENPLGGHVFAPAGSTIMDLDDRYQTPSLTAS